MSAKPHFTPAQQDVIRATAKKIWDKQFKWMKKVKKTKDHPGHPGGQEAMALALGVSQQTISALLDPKRTDYNPGFKVATAVANLDGKTLEQLIGDFGDPDEDDEEGEDSARSVVIETSKKMATVLAPETFPNLSTCLAFHSSSKHWSPWTIAAARAGFFGNADFAPPEWTGKLDILEKALERARKAG